MLEESIVGAGVRACPEPSLPWSERMNRGWIAITAPHHAYFIRNLGAHPWPAFEQQDLPLSAIHTAVRRKTDGVR